MCGIFGVLSKFEFNQEYKTIIEKSFDTIHYRGPDFHDLKCFNNRIVLGFHRLSIIGKENSMILHSKENDVYMTCNGEIYNYQWLYQKYGFDKVSESDCEIIIHLYTYYLEHEEYTIKDLLNELDGVFAFVLIDLKNNKKLVARDRYGVRPLYHSKITNIGNVFASEGKSLVDLVDDTKYIYQFPPSCYVFNDLLDDDVGDAGDVSETGDTLPFTNYYDLYEHATLHHLYEDQIHQNIRLYLNSAVKKRLMTERPIGFLLSGGLDSSLIASIGNRFIDGPITTFSIGFENSPDLINARKVADDLKSNHHEVILTPDDLEMNLTGVIYALETPDITTIRASLPMYILSKYIRENTDIKVIFSGEGSDEIFGGYLYFHNAPSYHSFQKECCRLLDNLHKYDLLRGDRTTAHFGLELRVPFLDKDFTEFILNIDGYWKSTKRGMEKQILRDAYAHQDYLPDDILYRQKEAFSDGVGSQSVRLLKQLTNQNEKEYYKKQCDAMFQEKIVNIHELWMPKWNDHIDDPSATYLSVHQSNKP